VTSKSFQQERRQESGAKGLFAADLIAIELAAKVVPGEAPQSQAFAAK
jgi:hypothetical protein